jgi:hypothetical protein
MDYFFFGTLMDLDVAAIVLGRPLAAGDRAAATAHGFKRAMLAGESYPAMVPRAGGAVEGVLVRGVTPAEALRIAWFEDGEYDVVEIVVTLATGERRPALACLRRPEVALVEGDWSLPRWQRDDKPAFLDLARGWMELFGRASVAEAEALWQRGRRAAALDAGARRRSRS